MNAIIKYLSSNLTTTESDRIYKDLIQLFEEEQIYLKKDICLKSVADRLSSNTKYVSQVVNTKRNCNFQVFVNRYRVQDFKERMLQGGAQLFTLYGLARECGFNNRSTFYRSFKDETGLTPKDFYSLHSAA